MFAIPNMEMTMQFITIQFQWQIASGKIDAIVQSNCNVSYNAKLYNTVLLVLS